jgi:hypothetical protein
MGPEMDRRVELPPFARPVRDLASGVYPYLTLLPAIFESPALKRIGNAAHKGEELVRAAVVHIRPDQSFCWVDEDVPCIVLSERYYKTGSDLDLYLDLLHEVTHIRQHHEGKDLWDSSFEYHRRPTEIEGYAVAIEEGRRLGMSEAAIFEHLSNPWMSPAQVKELLEAINAHLRA